MTLLLRAGRLLLGASVAAAATAACYGAGGGKAPPAASFYYPTGLAVSSGGNVLYAVNSDFDLQWNGGTLQSYDLFLIRQHAAQLVQANLSNASPPPSIPFLEPWQPGQCPGSPPAPTNDQSGIGVPIGEACAPPVDSTFYQRDSVIVGAFATDLQLGLPPTTGQSATRLFAPIRGNGTVTWADIAPDDMTTAPAEGTTQSFAPFALDCGTRVDGRCDASHQTGNDPNAPGNTRHATLPGDPFGMAQTEDGTALVVTSLTAQQTSVLTTGLGSSSVVDPVMQFALGGMPSGGNGIAAVPHVANGAAGYTRCEDVGDAEPCFRPAFLQTNTGAGEIDLLRYYDDDGSTLHRPFIQKEAVFPLTLGSGGNDFRGIAIDPTPRMACAASATTAAQKTACAQRPARVFIASRTPPALILGEIGQSVHGGAYDPDALVITGLVPMPNGPSRVYLAPIVDAAGNYELRVFVVCFDSSLIWVFDPEAGAFENSIPTGLGPYAMAFDPFDLMDVATHRPVKIDPRQPNDLALKRYRFAYVASFTHSYLQVLDLDDSMPSQQTFESIVYTLGKPTPPKGS